MEKEEKGDIRKKRKIFSYSFVQRKIHGHPFVTKGVFNLLKGNSHFCELNYDPQYNLCKYYHQTLR